MAAALLGPFGQDSVALMPTLGGQFKWFASLDPKAQPGMIKR